MMAVKTNVGYQEVAMFVCQHEDADSIAEALQMIRDYLTKNGIKIDVIMTDNCKAEAEAIARVFPGNQDTCIKILLGIQIFGHLYS